MYGYKYKEVAEMCGVTMRTVANWKKKQNIPLWALYKLGLTVIKQEEAKQ